MAAIDWDFISALEGACVLRGYIPKELDTKNSGVTVASGVDLGHRRASILYTFGLPVDVLDEIAIYCGTRGVFAEKLLDERPLSLSLKQARLLDDCVRRIFVDRVRERWNRDSTRAWGELTVEQRTTVMSVSWQYGEPWLRTPTFWRLTTNSLWGAALNELLDFGDDYPTRRRTEAEYLRSGEMT
jgi:hypothetical protein|tara:strand:+ start:1446 stop:2000 length:555 start_codon:yes stop_codon:yes gene_type:complete